MTLETPPAISRSSIDRVWDALDRGGFKPEKRADKFMALCPVHGDTHRSLSVRWDAGREATLLHCFTCNADVRDIAAALGLTVSDTFDRPLPPKSERNTAPRKRREVTFRPPHKLPPRLVQQPVVDDELRGAQWDRVKVYRYEGLDGAVVQEVYREQAIVDDVTHKRFTQRFRGPSGRMVTRKPEGFTPVLYRHRDVVDAVKTGKPVWLVEGEKDADNAAALGLTATTNAQGAGSFPEELADVLAGAIVNVVADQDTAGYRRAVTLHDLLTSKGATVRILLPAVDDDKADLTDHLEAGHGIGDLVEISSLDASALARLGEARKALAQIGDCKAEIQAHLAAAAETSDSKIADQHREDARTWADEAEIRFRRLLEAADGPSLFGDDYGAAGQRALEAIKGVVDDAAVLSAEAHELAGVRVPASISERLRARDLGGRVVGIGGSDDEPPVYRGHDSLPDDDGAENEGARYAVRLGETVLVKRERDGEKYRNRYVRILRGWAEVQNVAVDDDGNGDSNSRATHEMTVRFFRWIRDIDGKPVRDEHGQPQIEDATVTWDADQIRDGSWAQSMPWPGMLESTSRRGKDQAWDAIFNARPVPATRTRSTVYVASGWREAETGPFFVHAGGAIARGGSIPVQSRFADAFKPFHLPEPSSEPEVLRQAWEIGTMPLRRELPARVIAPLLGVVWESVFERVPFITHLVGGRAAYKTSTARVACQYFAPELHFRGRREILSGANMGGTVIGIIRALSITNYLPVLIDDVAPDGNAKRAQQKLSELARLIYNETGRVTGKQRGGINADQPTKATVITTGELSVTGSAQTRMLAIPLDPGALAKGSGTFAELERSANRHARGVLGASLIRWIAEHRDNLKAEIEDEDHPNGAAALHRYWRDRIDDLPHDAGLKDRLTEAATSADHGIRLMLRMLKTTGALTAEEANDFYQWAEGGIYQAIAMQDAASGDPAEQLLGYLREALSSGAAHLTDEKGELPENAGAFGWSVKGTGQYATWNANGPRIGVIKGDRVYLIPSTTIGVAMQVAARADETFAETSVSISSALHAHGWLEVDKSGKRGVGRRIDGALVRVWDMPLDVITGGDENGDGGPQEPISPAPSLFDVDEGADPAAESPQEPPTTPPPADEATTAETAVNEAGGVSQAASAAPAPARRPSKAAASPYRAAVAVMHTDGIWLPDGERVPLEKPIEHLGDVARLVTGLRLGVKNGWRDEDGQILVTHDAALALGIPVDQLPRGFEVTAKLKELTRDHPLITKAIDAGFNVGGTDRSLNTTTRVWNDEARGRFVLLPALKDDFKHIVDDDPDPVTIARRLQRFADALRAPYAISASTTGLDLMFTLHWRDRERLFAPSQPVPPAEIPTLEADIEWQRKPTDTELEHRWVHAYDRGGSYLAGISGLELGIGEPTYFPEGREFDKRLPGYWRITMPAKGEWLTPNPIDPRNRADDIAGKLTWVTTPTLDVAVSLGYEDLEIHEAYVWEQHSRIYDTWYERVRDARAELDTLDVDDQRARDLLKEVYVRSLGLTASFEHHKDRPGFAPERYHFIQARAKANIIRRIHQIGRDTGRWPVAISKDTVLYTSDESDPIAAWPGKPEQFGRGLGQYKYEGSAPLREHLQYLTGEGRYEGKASLEELL